MITLKTHFHPLLTVNIENEVRHCRFHYWKNQIFAHITVIAITALSIVAVWWICSSFPSYFLLGALATAFIFKISFSYIYLPCKKNAEHFLEKLESALLVKTKIEKYKQIPESDRYLSLRKEHARCGAIPLSLDLERAISRQLRLDNPYSPLTYIYAKIHDLHKTASRASSEVSSILFAKPAYVDPNETIPNNFKALEECLLRANLKEAQRKAYVKKREAILTYCNRKYLQHIEARIEAIFLAYVASNPLFHNSPYSLFGKCQILQNVGPIHNPSIKNLPFFVFSKETPPLTLQEIEDIDKQSMYTLFRFLLPLTKLNTEIIQLGHPDPDIPALNQDEIFNSDDDFSFITHLVTKYLPASEEPRTFHQMAEFFKENYREILSKEPLLRNYVYRISSQTIQKEIFAARDPTNMQAKIFQALVRGQTSRDITEEDIRIFQETERQRGDPEVQRVLKDVEQRILVRIGSAGAIS